MNPVPEFDATPPLPADGWPAPVLFNDAAHEAEDETPERGLAPGDGACAASAQSLPQAATETQLAAWIEAVGLRDEGALAALYTATLPRVYGLVLKIVRTAALAEEVVEDTFFQVWRQALRFDPKRGAPMAWLLGMARSRAIDTLRREARFRHQVLDAEPGSDLLDPTPAADDLLAVARGHAELQRALMLLNAQPRQLVALAFFRGLSHEEIAQHTRLPLGTVKSQIRRALAVLRQALGDSGFPQWSAR
jgi:RNA polymerase sigma-70 factor (ECF subfamily)